MINDCLTEIPSNIYEFSKFFLKKYKLKLFFILLIAIFSAIISAYFPSYVLKITVNSYENNTLTLHLGFFYVFLYIFSFSCNSLFDILKNKLNLITNKLIQKDITDKIFNSILHYDIKFFNDNYSGDLSSKFNNLIVNFDVFLSYIVYIITYTLFFFVVLITISFINFYMFLITIIWVVLFYFSLNKSLKNRKEKFEIVSKNSNMASGVINDCLVNIGNIKSFAKEKKEILNVKKQTLKIIKSQRETITPSSSSFVRIYFFQNIYSFVMLIFSFYLLKNNEINLANFMFLFQLISLSRGYIRSDLESIIHINEITARLKNSLNTLITEIKIKDKKDAEDLKVKEGKIVFKNILFSYN